MPARSISIRPRRSPRSRRRWSSGRCRRARVYSPAIERPSRLARVPPTIMKEAPMIDHMSLPVSDYARAKAFYLKALAPLGYGIAMEVTPEESGGASYVGFGNDRKPYFWLAPSEGPQ